MTLVEELKMREISEVGKSLPRIIPEAPFSTMVPHITLLPTDFEAKAKARREAAIAKLLSGI